MAARERADLGFGAEAEEAPAGAGLRNFDPADWAPAAPPARPAPAALREGAAQAGLPQPPLRTARARARARADARALGLAGGGGGRRPPSPMRRAVPSTPAAPAAPAAPPRRRRTGRNAQLNLKLRPDTIDAFYAIADAQGWGLGETMERAVALLQREISDG